MVDSSAGASLMPAGCGEVILGENVTVARELSRYLGHTTNNVASGRLRCPGIRELIETQA